VNMAEVEDLLEYLHDEIVKAGNDGDIERIVKLQRIDELLRR